MSMNIFVRALRPIRYQDKYGNWKSSVQNDNFELWQTPTKVSYEIRDSAYPILSYEAWILSISEEKKMPIHEDGDFFCEKPPIGYETYHPGKDHIKELREWINVVENNGYTVEFIVL